MRTDPTNADPIAVMAGKAPSPATAAVRPSLSISVKAAIRSLRPHQWAKNALIFLPLILAHRFGDVTAVSLALMAFLAFSLAASGVYLINDMMDVAQDRKHPVKKNRPIASGLLSVRAARLLAALCFVTAAAITLRLPVNFAIVLGGYLTLNIAYTFYLKRKLLVDVMALAAAYTLRIMAGAVATGIDQSFWLLTFSSFLFLSLALVKRYVELDTVGDEESSDKKRVMGRGYRVNDLDMLAQLGVASAFAAVLVLALYVDGQGRMGLYKTPEFIWLICPVVLYVIGRIWVLAKRRELPDDPVLFILKDWRSHLMGLFVVVIMLAARHYG
jgi:4-hydroxybenzoate polyprenyltransferase